MHEYMEYLDHLKADQQFMEQELERMRALAQDEMWRQREEKWVRLVSQHQLIHSNTLADKFCDFFEFNHFESPGARGQGTRGADARRQGHTRPPSRRPR